MRTRSLLFSLLLLPPVAGMAQDRPAYPQDYFRNPLNIPIFLAGNFGECRPGHFHSGLDIKTQGKENEPVHAAAAGYISRIKMEKGGFGHALYVTHPNGYTTLYAHLNKFAPAIQRYLESQQYAAKRWDVDLPLSPAMFPVKKGEQIAWSGNTGGSTAPHLHFEIRDTKTEHPLNPELFGMPLTDHTAPVPKAVVFYEGVTTPFYESYRWTMDVTKKGDDYRPLKFEANEEGNLYEADLQGDTALVTGWTRIGVNVDDYMDSSTNTLAFYTMELYMDDTLQARVTLDNIGYEETRYINAYADYKIKRSQGKWVQDLFQLPGNRLNGIYSGLNKDRGMIKLRDARAHKIGIVITDCKNNRSNINFYAADKQRRTGHGFSRVTDYSSSPRVHLSTKKAAGFDQGDIKFTLDSNQVYEDMECVLRTTNQPNGYSGKYTFGDPSIPIHHYFDLEIKPTKDIPESLTRKVVMKYSDDKDEDGRAAALAADGRYKAKVRNFGTYWLDIDTIPPVITPMLKDGANLGKAKRISFNATDAVTFVRGFSGYIDGKWVCFEQHGDSFFYDFDGHCPKGKHKLVFKAEDENGNAGSVSLSFTR